VLSLDFVMVGVSSYAYARNVPDARIDCKGLRAQVVRLCARYNANRVGPFARRYRGQSSQRILPAPEELPRCAASGLDRRAYTRVFLTCFSSSDCDLAASCGPVIMRSLADAIPSCRATARAVAGGSPVILTGTTPAWRQTRTSSSASGRGGSIRPANPKNVSESSVASAPPSPAQLDHGRYATASTSKSLGGHSLRGSCDGRPV